MTDAEEIATLRAEVERLTRERDEWRAQCSEAEADRDEYKSQINEAWSAAQAELCKAIDMRKRADAAERKSAMAVETLNVVKVTILKCRDQSVFSSKDSVVKCISERLPSIQYTLAELEKADG